MTLSFKKAARWLFFCLPALLVTSQNSLAFDKKVSSALTHYIMGVMHEDSGDIDKAIQEYKKAVQADRESAVIHLSLASGYLKKNDFAGAIEELKAAAKIDPGAIEPHAILALIYTSQNKPELARSEYELALRNAARAHPDNVDIYKTLGILYIQGGKYKEAEGAYRMVVKLSPGDPEARFYLATIYSGLKKNELAEKEIKLALKLKPDYHQALNFLGYLYLEQDKNISQAGELIRKALVFEPDNGAYIDSLGWFYFKRGDYQQALKQLIKASSLVEDPVIYDHLGDAYFKTKDIANARLNWEKSLNLDPGQEGVREKIKKISNEPVRAENTAR